MVNRSFVLTTTKDRLIDLLRYTLDISIYTVIGGMIMLIYTGQPPVYNPELILFFVVCALVMSFLHVAVAIFFGSCKD